MIIYIWQAFIEDGFVIYLFRGGHGRNAIIV